VIAEALTVDIGEREVRQVEIVHPPNRRIGFVPALSLAGEDEFEAVALPVSSVHVARVVPPFGTEIGMFEVIARKVEMVSGQRLPIDGRHREEEDQKEFHSLTV